MMGFIDISNTFSLANIQALQVSAEESYLSDSTPLTYTSTAISEVLSAGETYIFEDMHMDNIYDLGIDIDGQEGAGQTVIIRNCKFTDIRLPFRVRWVDNVIIEGNYIDDVWAAMHIMVNKNVTVKYNKIKNHGVKAGFSNTMWAGNAIHLAWSTLDSLDVSHNLVDRSSDSRVNTHENTFAEDYFGIYRCTMSGTNKGYFADNYIMGSEQHCESGSGGGITIDQQGHGFVLERNTTYNTGSFCLGIASSQNIELYDNLGFQTQVHDSYIETNAKHPADLHSGPNKNSQLTITEWHAEGTTPTPIENITLTGNRLMAVRADGSENHQWLDCDLNELNSDSNNNSFVIDLSNGGQGQLTHPTQTEVYEAIVGADESGMFLTHGQGTNYFDESRTTV